MTEKETYYSEVFTRTALCIGAEALESLSEKKVLVCGLGGVGSHAAVSLARSGIGKLALCDCDVTVKSNINRQIQANLDSVGRYKTEVLKEIISKINPYCEVTIFTEFIEKSRIPALTEGCDFVIDAIDTVTAKLDLAEYCVNNGIAIVSSMGTGNKLHPEMLELSDIYKTSVCPLAKVMRSELKKRGIRRLTVCYSKECAVRAEGEDQGGASLMKPKRKTIGSTSFVPPTAGYILSSYVIRTLCELQ